MNIALLDAKTLGDDLNLEALNRFGNVTIYPTTSQQELPERIKNSDIVITNKVVISKESMEISKNLKLICIAATGMNNVDLDAAKVLGISVKNVSGYSTKSVAQHTFSMALYLLEKMVYLDNVVKSKTWSKSGLFTDVSKPFYEISGKKWGIIGLGEIGKEVAKIATVFGADVLYYSTSGRNRDSRYQRCTLEEILKRCDFVSIHAPLNKQTNNLINKENLPLLKANAILLNLGRGGIVNEADLAEVLNKQKLYVGLDVLTKEPIEENHPLLSIADQKQLLITPHIAWASIEARQKLLAGIVKNIQSFLEDQK